MNGKAVAIGALGAGLLALALFANPFGDPHPRVRPLEEPEAEPAGLGPRAPTATDVPPPGSTSPREAGSGASNDSPGATVVDGPAIRGVVIDSATSEPIAGAWIDLRASGPESRPATTRPRRRPPTDVSPGIPGGSGRSATLPTGRFSIPWPLETTAELRVSAPGHLDEFRPAITADEELRIALRPGVSIPGYVRRSDGAGIEGALVRAITSPREPEGRRRESLESTGRSDGNGSFEVLGLPGAASRIVVEHPEFMPTSVQAVPAGPALDLVLVAALRMSFRIRASDGGALAAPVVQWTRTGAGGRPLQMGVDDLGIGDDGADGASADGTWGPVRVPCEPADGTVRFVVTAPGRLPWTSDEIAVPAGGAERTLDLALERDPAAGSVAVRVVDPDGHELALPGDGTIVNVRRTDGAGASPRAVAREGALVFDGLPAGTYVVFATDRRFGAANAMTTIEGGRETRAEVRLSPPASLLVKIDAGARRRVQFQLLRDGAVVPAFEDPPAARSASSVAAAEAGRLHFLAGPDGTRLRGLAAGRYAVRIVSPDLVSADVEIEVPPGEAGEVEVRPKPR